LAPTQSSIKTTKITKTLKKDSTTSTKSQPTPSSTTASPGKQMTQTTNVNVIPNELMRMYFHSDTLSVHQLELHLVTKGKTGGIVGLSLDDPPSQYQASLLENLIKSRYHGCEYIRALLDNPERFYVRSQLLQYLIQAYFMTLWDKQALAGDGVTPLSSLLNFQILEGNHKEKAWINFRGNGPCEHEHKAPIARVQSPLISLYVNHPTAVQVHREKLATFFTSHALSIILNGSQLFYRFNYRGVLNMLETAALLGRDIPYYTVTVE